MGTIARETKRPRFVLVAKGNGRNCSGDETTSFRPRCKRKWSQLPGRRNDPVSSSLTEPFRYDKGPSSQTTHAYFDMFFQRGRNEVVSSPEQSRPVNEDDAGSLRLPGNWDRFLFQRGRCEAFRLPVRAMHLTWKRVQKTRKYHRQRTRESP